MKENIILASASPRRKELLGVITKDFEVIPSDAEETVPVGISADKTAEYLAKIKALSVAENYPESIVIGADTCVVADDVILGKPKDKAQARQMMELLSGKTHKVITGCAIIKNGKVNSFSVCTEVEFYSLSEEDYYNYGFDKLTSMEHYNKTIFNFLPIF